MCFHREFLWPTRYQMSFNFKYYCLNIKRLLPNMHYLMPVIQLYISSSVEACPLWKCCLVHLIIIIYYCHYYRDNGSQLLSRCTTRYLNYFTCDVKLTGNYRKNCAINAQAANHLKTAVIVNFSCTISGFTSNSRAPGGPCDIGSVTV